MLSVSFYAKIKSKQLESKIRQKIKNSAKQRQFTLRKYLFLVLNFIMSKYCAKYSIPTPKCF